MLSYRACLQQIEFPSYYKPVVFDVGCNINEIPSHCGTLDDFTELFLSQYSKSKVYGIDPLYWQAYEDKWKDDERVTLVKKALTDTVGTCTLYTPGSDNPIEAHAISSLYNRECFCEGIAENKVECTTLETLFDELDLEIIDYLKIDAEGAELSILKGSESLLKKEKISCIQLEYGGAYEDAGYTIKDVVEYLGSSGYKEFFRTNDELLFAHESDIPPD